MRHEQLPKPKKPEPICPTCKGNHYVGRDLSPCPTCECGKLVMTENSQLRAALNKATVRLEILLGRMTACHESHPTEHSVSLLEVPGWIEEQRATVGGLEKP